MEKQPLVTATETTDAPVPSPRRPGPGALFYVALAVAVLLTGTLAVIAIGNRSRPAVAQALRVSGLPSSISTPLANLMALSPIPPRVAPNFTLIDQHGRTLSLLQLRGRAVVLEFMDPHCIDICPLVAQEFIDANRDLGANSSHVVFAAVNVNQFFSRVANVEAFSAEHRLNTIASWHFFTGPTKVLHSVWRDYGVAVSAPHPRADILHTSVIYFIDPQGHERYVAAPSVQYTSKGAPYLPALSLTQWGHGIALMASSFTNAPRVSQSSSPGAG